MYLSPKLIDIRSSLKKIQDQRLSLPLTLFFFTASIAYRSFANNYFCFILVDLEVQIQLSTRFKNALQNFRKAVKGQPNQRYTLAQQTREFHTCHTYAIVTDAIYRFFTFLNIFTWRCRFSTSIQHLTFRIDVDFQTF